MSGNGSSLPARKISIFILFPLNLLILNAIVALAALIASRSSLVMTGITATILSLVVVTFSILKRQGSLSWTALVALAAAVICGMTLKEYKEVKGKAILKDVKLADAPKFSEAVGFKFTSGKVRPDMSGTYIDRSGGTDESSSIQFYYVAPVVEDDWTASQPVTVWAACQTVECTRQWKEDFRAGIKVSSLRKEDFAKAIAAAKSRHDLRSPPEAVIIRWVSSPEEAREKYKRDFWSALKIWNVIWIVGFISARLFFRWKRPEPKSSLPG